MERITQGLSNVLKPVDAALSVLKTNTYVSAALVLFLVLYAGLAAPRLPAAVAALFEYNIFKALVMLGILVINQYNTTVAVLVAVGFLISLLTLSQYRLFAVASDVGAMKQAATQSTGKSLPRDQYIHFPPQGRMQSPPVEQSSPDGVPTDASNLATIGLPESEL